MQYNIVPCYIFEEDSFIDNYKRFEKTFKNIYSKYQIGYSFKTNYTPYICKIVKKLGGYAEVVSKMEYNLAKSLGYDDSKIIFNGPCKGIYPNCILNVDSLEEILKTGSNKIGLRVNIDVGQNFISRFGIDSNELDKAFEIAGDRIVGLHCHISQARSIDAWKKRAEIMLDLVDKYFKNRKLEYVDLGSGMYGNMDEELKSQFSNVPSYEDYADVVAGMFANHFKGDEKPILFTEPGTTLINKYIKFVSKVESIKHIKGKTFVVLTASKHNLGEICELKKLPLEIIHNGNELEKIENGDLVGYTCLEHDVMYKDFTGELAVGDIVIFNNVGGYSLVSKPPFIRPNCPMFTNSGLVIKRQETNEEIFATYE